MAQLAMCSLLIALKPTCALFFFIFPGQYSCRAATVTLSCTFKPSGYAHFLRCTYKGELDDWEKSAADITLA